jgi:D-arabinose 1-dehydrogenase-like Zn-dependent alcohol dehydrogenase
MSSVLPGLGVDGKLVVLGVGAEPIEAAPLPLILARRSISGWPSGTATDSEDTLNFSVMSDVRPAVETFPLAKAAEAYQHMMSGKARFRVVLTP